MIKINDVNKVKWIGKLLRNTSEAEQAKIFFFPPAPNSGGFERSGQYLKVSTLVACDPRHSHKAVSVGHEMIHPGSIVKT